MGYITMSHARFLAGTTKNPIKRAIALGDIFAYKDNLGHWQIGEKTFLNWLSQRRAAGSAASYEADDRCAWHEAKAPSQAAIPSTLIAGKLSDLKRAEEDAWRHAPRVPADARYIYIKHLTMIDDQKLFLESLNQVK
ncbi:MAG: hypothetical protein ABNH38_01110 [Tateyamaria sp.]|jgi:hypothetical protein|uniref:hypothetical protein n=1 Tax=Tateyamaria sp. TaxID=1929288 RepID=UPI0032DCDB99